MITVIHRTGKHWANLSSLTWVFFRLFRRGTVELDFGLDSKYWLDTYLGWNKVMGKRNITGKNGRYLVWRYLPRTNEFQVSDKYYREHGQIIFPKAEDIVTIKNKGSVVWKLPKWGYSIPILPYFGGIYPAPETVIYRIK